MTVIGVCDFSNEFGHIILTVTITPIECYVILVFVHFLRHFNLSLFPLFLFLSIRQTQTKYRANDEIASRLYVVFAIEWHNCFSTHLKKKIKKNKNFFSLRLVKNNCFALTR